MALADVCWAVDRKSLQLGKELCKHWQAMRGYASIEKEWALGFPATGKRLPRFAAFAELSQREEERDRIIGVTKLQPTRTIQEAWELCEALWVMGLINKLIVGADKRCFSFADDQAYPPVTYRRALLGSDHRRAGGGT